MLKPKTVNRIGSGMIAVGAVLGFSGVFAEISGLIAFSAALLLSSVLFHVIFYRCPHCWKYLDRSNGDFCPYCGKEVNE